MDEDDTIPVPLSREWAWRVIVGFRRLTNRTIDMTAADGEEEYDHYLYLTGQIGRSEKDARDGARARTRSDLGNRIAKKIEKTQESRIIR
jgi:hypothetical protein